MNEIITYILALFVGSTMGLLGGGGAILTIPILVYIAGFNPILATSYSIVIVGISALFGAINKYKKNEIDVKKGLYFGIPSIFSIFITRKFIINFLPERIISIDDIELFKDDFVLLLFSVIMILASYSMFKGRNEIVKESSTNNYYPLVFLGLIFGILVGIIGAGGGFLIIPTLVSFTGMKMKNAVGTSLFIITLNSLFGFLGDLMNEVKFDFIFLALFTLVSIIGIYFGSFLSNYISGHKLKKYFAIFIFIMAVYMIIKEIL